MIAITTIDSLPDYCYECPCHDGERGHCQADKERRYSEYRPYWCPLKEIHDNQEEIKKQFIEAFNTIRDAYNIPANREKILMNYLLRNACCCE